MNRAIISWRTSAKAALLASVLALVVACGGDDSSGSGDPDSTDILSRPDELCDLFSDSEITEVIGEHHPGQHDYAYGGCHWLATVEMTGSGFVPGIRVTVLNQREYEGIAEEGADPIDGFGAGATYHEWGELWFPCRSGEFCGLVADIDDPDEREDVAIRLGHLLQERV